MPYVKSISPFLSPTMLFLLLLTGILSCKEKKPDEGDPATSVENETPEGYVRIFNGTTLEGWKGDPAYWRVEHGNLVGEVTPETLLKTNTFITWEGGQPGDFELQLEFRITESGNSGINYRSERLDTIPYALRGYQADIDGKNTYTGQNYEERKRTTLAYRGEKVVITAQDNAEEPGSLRAAVKNNAWQYREVVGSLGNIDSLKAEIHSEDWNKCRLLVRGRRMQHYINGILMSDVTDNDSINRTFKGVLGVQVHVGPPMKVEYRNILLKE